MKYIVTIKSTCVENTTVDVDVEAPDTLSAALKAGAMLGAEAETCNIPGFATHIAGCSVVLWVKETTE